MKQYKLYLFDLDGTLIDSDQMLIETFRELYSIYRPLYHPSDDYITLQVRLSHRNPQGRGAIGYYFTK